METTETLPKTRKDAKQVTSILYYTGILCKNGHDAPRRTSNGACVRCENETNHKRKDKYDKWVSEHIAHVNEIKRKWAYDKYNNDNTFKKNVLNRAKRYRDANKEKIAEQQKNWREKNEKYGKEYYEKNKERILECNRTNPNTKEHRRRWNTSNKGHKLFLTRMRQKKIKQATPFWACLDDIREFYIICQKLTEETNIPHHVDHIIPISNDLVCGLHIASNLQILTKSENLTKGNKFTV